MFLGNIKLGKVKRREVSVSATYYNFDKEFEEAMSWIDEEVQVLSMNVLERNEANYYVRYEVIYREVTCTDEDED